MSTLRRCALPGCDAVIELQEGDQPRRYCCPEHRRASRFSRRVQEAAAKAAEPPAASDAPAAERPSLFQPAALDLPPRARLSSSRAMLDVVPPPVNRDQGRRAASRRQRAIAVLATTAVFAGAGWAASTQTPTTPSPTPGAGAAMPTSDQPVPKRTAAEWATEAQQTLDSVNQQLDLVAQAEEMWNRQPAAVRSGPTPPAVQEMQARRVVLGQQKALLQLQLDTYKSLDSANRELVDAEQKVAAADRAIPSDPQAANSPEARRLAEQRDLLARRLDATRQGQASLHTAVDKAVTSPLPDRSDRTKPIVDSVIGLVRDPLRRQPPAVPDNKPPAAVPPQTGPTRPRQDVNNVAPPRPGLPSLGTGNAPTPRTSTPAESAAAAPSRPATPPAPNSQPAMTMLDSPGAAETPPPSSGSAPTTSAAESGNNYNGNWSPSPRPRQDSSSWDLSQLSSQDGSSSGWTVSRGSNWSADDARALMSDGGSSHGGSSHDGGSRGGSRGGGSHGRR